MRLSAIGTCLVFLAVTGLPFGKHMLACLRFQGDRAKVVIRSSLSDMRMRLHAEQHTRPQRSLHAFHGALRDGFLAPLQSPRLNQSR